MWRKQKKTDAVPKLKLEDIIGLTTKNGDGFASDASIGICAYLAGCAVVLYDVGVDARSHLMVSSRAPKPLSCVAMARQGRRFAAAGESGQAPGILIWDLSSGSLLSDLKGHQYGVQSVDFSADGKTLVSIGFPNDGYLCVWDWKSGKLSAKVKASATLSPLISVSFISEGNSFVTVGRKHLKLWQRLSCTGKDIPLVDGKPLNLGYYRNRSFVSVASHKPNSGDPSGDSFSVYALTETGLLCAIDSGFLIKKYVDLEVEKGHSLSLSTDLIACACNSGVVQLFQVGKLVYVESLKYGEASANFDQKDVVCNDIIPDAIACKFVLPTKLGVIYADHCFYLWDIDHIEKISKCCVLVSHCAGIWDIKNLPSEDNCLEVSFATCSADGTIRQWDLGVSVPSESTLGEQELATNQEKTSLVNDNSCSSVQLVSCGILEHGNDDIKLDGQAFKAMAVSSDRQYLAAGDFNGNLHLFNLHNSSYTCIKEAHKAELNTLSFSKKSRYLVTGSKDRKISIYNATRNFELVECLEDHSAAINSVILAYDDSKLISCGADKCIHFRDVLVSDTGCKVLRRQYQSTSNGGIVDVAIDPSEKIIVTVGQDRKINKHSLHSTKLVGTFKEEAELGQPLKVLVDPTGSYIVCSYSSKSLRIYDFTTREVVAQAMGHAEAITGFVFLSDLRHIISVSGDSCIFIWKLPSILSSKMLHKVKDKMSADNSLTTQRDDVYEREIELIGDDGVSDVGGPEDPAFEFSVSRLPKWARTKVTGKSSIDQESDVETSHEVLSAKCSVDSSQSDSLKCVDFSQPTSVEVNARNEVGPASDERERNENEITEDKVVSSASLSQTCDSSSFLFQGEGENLSAHFQTRRFNARRFSTLKRAVETINPSLSLDPVAKRSRNNNNQKEGADDETLYEMNQLGKILETLDEASEKAVDLCGTFDDETKREEMIMLLKDYLPSISKRVEALNNLGLGGSRASLQLGSTVERFAVALSDRVLELLKDKI